MKIVVITLQYQIFTVSNLEERGCTSISLSHITKDTSVSLAHALLIFHKRIAPLRGGYFA